MSPRKIRGQNNPFGFTVLHSIAEPCEFQMELYKNSVQLKPFFNRIFASGNFLHWCMRRKIRFAVLFRHGMV